MENDHIEFHVYELCVYSFLPFWNVFGCISRIANLTAQRMRSFRSYVEGVWVSALRWFISNMELEGAVCVARVFLLLVSALCISRENRLPIYLAPIFWENLWATRERLQILLHKWRWVSRGRQKLLEVMGESLWIIMDGKLEENGKEQMRMISWRGENKELEQQRTERATRQMGWGDEYLNDWGE